MQSPTRVDGQKVGYVAVKKWINHLPILRKENYSEVTLVVESPLALVLSVSAQDMQTNFTTEVKQRLLEFGQNESYLSLRSEQIFRANTEQICEDIVKAELKLKSKKNYCLAGDASLAKFTKRDLMILGNKEQDFLAKQQRKKVLVKDDLSVSVYESLSPAVPKIEKDLRGHLQQSDFNSLARLRNKLYGTINIVKLIEETENASFSKFRDLQRYQDKITHILQNTDKNTKLQQP